MYISLIYCQYIELNCEKALCSEWQAEWDVRPHRNLRWTENSLFVDCHFALREMCPCFFLAMITNLKSPQRTLWWWAMAPESYVLLPSWSLLWVMRLQFLRKKKGVKKASLSGNSVMVLEQKMPVSFHRWHKLVHPHLKGCEREKQSLYFIYLYWTKPIFWALLLFERFRHNYRGLMKFPLLITFGKQNGYGLRLSGTAL